MVLDCICWQIDMINSGVSLSFPAYSTSALTLQLPLLWKLSRQTAALCITKKCSYSDNLDLGQPAPIDSSWSFVGTNSHPSHILLRCIHLFISRQPIRNFVHKASIATTQIIGILWWVKYYCWRLTLCVFLCVHIHLFYPATICLYESDLSELIRIYIYAYP